NAGARPGEGLAPSTRRRALVVPGFELAVVTRYERCRPLLPRDWLSFEHDLFRKPLSTFRDHASCMPASRPACILRSMWRTCAQARKRPSSSLSAHLITSASCSLACVNLEPMTVLIGWL